jgi:hypothetical protein
MKLFFNKQPLGSLDEALDRYRPEEFQSPTRSTVPLLSLLKHGDAIWRSLLQCVDSAGTAEAHLEFTVNPPQGSGTASHTDVMLIDGEHAFAIEAKWTEPRYDNIAGWLKKGDTAQEGRDVLNSGPAPNRRDVLNGWLSLLQHRVTGRLNADDFSSAVYQMVHRAASACAAGRLPTLIYVQFCPLPDGSPVESGLMGDLCRLQSLLGSAANFPFWLAKVEARPSRAFERVRSLPKGVKETADAVRAALRGEPLFTFTDVSFLPVKGAGCR